MYFLHRIHVFYLPDNAVFPWCDLDLKVLVLPTWCFKEVVDPMKDGRPNLVNRWGNRGLSVAIPKPYNFFP